MTSTTPSERADALYAARRDRAPIAPFSEQDPGMTPADAYEVQGHFVQRLLADGGEVVGYKLGLTSAPMQQLLGVDEPDYGPVLSTMVFDDRAEIALEQFCQPKIEAEIGLVLDRPLSGPDVSAFQASRAIGGAVAALELVDSRIADWRISLVDTVADLASSAAAVVGSRVVALDGFDVRNVGMVIRRNGAVEATGAGAAALGDPVTAVAWLANTLAPYGVTLEPGHLIMTGSLHAAFELAAGDRVRADFDRLGSVGCRFV
jgi:2-keto-4-pentenoate hydratase